MNARLDSLDTTPRTFGGSTPGYLGPAAVTEVDGRSVYVALPDGRRAAVTMALAYPYEPVVGDTLLVIGEQPCWGIGVVEGRGERRLRFAGDVSIHAVGGTVKLRGDRGVRIDGPELEVLVDRLAIVADSTLQRFHSFCRRVRDVVSTTAGESHRIVHGTSLERAKKFAVVAEETASVNGKQILLG